MNKPCKGCDGFGYVVNFPPYAGPESPCPLCNGVGLVDTKPFPRLIKVLVLVSAILVSWAALALLAFGCLWLAHTL